MRGLEGAAREGIRPARRRRRVLRVNGVAVEIEGDDLIVRRPRSAHGRRLRLDPHGSPHRHVVLVMGLASEKPVRR